MDHQVLINRIDSALVEKRLTAWQRTFLKDIRGRLERYGNRARLSEKQLQKLREIVGDDNVVPLRAPIPKAHSQLQRGWRPRKRLLLEREARWWARRFMRDFAFAAALVLGFLVYQFFDRIPAWLSTVSSPSTSFHTQSFTVTDGDTIRMNDGTPVRLVGINAPEKFEPKCEREAELGNRASERLKQLVASGKTTVTQVACSCKPGTEGTSECNHGRSCGVLKVDGRDVGQTLISEGLAVPFICGRTSCPPTPRPWCG